MLPPQSVVDDIAHFMQAAKELGASPLFSEDHGRISFEGEINGGEVDLQHIVLPNPLVRDAAVLCFRKIWMANEPSNYQRTINALKRYAPALRGEVEDCEQQLAVWFRCHTNSWVSKATSLAPRDVLELWINARLAHAGKTATKGRFTRADFETHVGALGLAHFEALFIHAVQAVGTGFLMLLRLAEKAMRDMWVPLGMDPEVFSASVAHAGTSIDTLGVRLTRSSPGIVVEQETRRDRLARYLNRDAFTSLRRFFQLLRLDSLTCVELLAATSDLDAFLSSLPFTRTIERPDPLKQGARGTKSLDRESFSVWEVIITDAGDIYLDEHAVRVFSREIRSILALP
jgi:hypothetical protein